MTLGSTLLRVREIDGPLGEDSRWETMECLFRVLLACSVVALDPVRRIAKGDGRLDGAEELRFSDASAGPGADPHPGEISRAETVGASGGLVLDTSLCLPPR